MPLLQIKNYCTNAVIYEGRFPSVRACVEQAVREKVKLDYADLRHASLANADLDDGVLRHARLDYTNLTGANLSEVRLESAIFRGATLHGACLCFSDLTGCDFEDSQFGGSDIAGARIEYAQFSLPSSFSLNFTDAESLTGCTYLAANGQRCPFSRPPVVIHGLSLPVIFLDRHLLAGETVLSYEEWARISNDNNPGARPENGVLYAYFRQHRQLFRALAGSRAELP